MLGNSPVYANIPVTDIKRATEFYSKKLGLVVEAEEMQSIALLKGGESTRVLLYERPPSKADHTLASFVVDDIYKSVKELKTIGITFEQYDFGNGIKTNEDGVMEMGPSKAAWFKDSEGNILALNQKI
jgi:predicted enzyme related to lactoylglutathione lyase